MITFKAQRIAGDGLSSIARWMDPEGNQLCFCLEPGDAREPHPGIRPGTYRLGLNTAGAKSQQYAVYYGDKFGIGWHKGMIELQGVPGRTAIEFHCGNTLADTEGCSLAGENFLRPPGNGSGHYEVERSRSAYERVYPVLRDAVLSGGASIEVLPIAEEATA